MGIAVCNSIEDGIKRCFGEKTSIQERSRVGGGDINDSFSLHLSDGNEVFVKTNTIENHSFFDAEEVGLSAIASTKAIGTVTPLCKGIDKEKNISFLMMEMVPRCGMIKGFFSVFGRELARMHLKDTGCFVTGGKFGFISDNYIGATKQINHPEKTWIDFFREHRLEPQFRMAERYFDHVQMAEITRLLDKLEDILTEPEKPSLLHGDLWSGNFITGLDGKAWLIDPAVYVGNAEADIAMTELFGRFPEDFYEGYKSVYPIQPEYRDRRDLYNLYHLLNHLNLFGRSYLSSVNNIVRHYVHQRGF